MIPDLAVGLIRVRDGTQRSAEQDASSPRSDGCRRAARSACGGRWPLPEGVTGRLVIAAFQHAHLLPALGFEAV